MRAQAGKAGTQDSSQRSTVRATRTCLGAQKKELVEERELWERPEFSVRTSTRGVGADGVSGAGEGPALAESERTGIKQRRLQVRAVNKQAFRKNGAACGNMGRVSANSCSVFGVLSCS